MLVHPGRFFMNLRSSMRSAGNLKTLANQAYDTGDFAGALSLYTQVRACLSRFSTPTARRDAPTRRH
jgi:hypothetical protein